MSKVTEVGWTFPDCKVFDTVVWVGSHQSLLAGKWEGNPFTCTRSYMKIIMEKTRAINITAEK